MNGRPLHRAAFSMIELTVALAVTSILLVAMGSAVVIASRAIPDGDDPTSAALESGRALERLSSDLQHAGYIAKRGAHAVTFTVADRNGDGSPERIRYAWSGTAGDPLTRQLNDTSAVPVVSDVQMFELGYHTSSQQVTYEGPAVVSSEQRLGYVDSLLGLGTETRKIRSDSWIGQRLLPNLPADTVWWRPTRVLFRGTAHDSADGQFYVQMRGTDPAGLPDTHVHAHDTISESLLGSLLSGWDEAEFDAPPTYLPGAPASLVFRHKTGPGSTGEVQYYDNTSIGGLSEGDGAGAWAKRDDETLRYYLYGKVATAGGTQQLTRKHFTGVDVKLRTGDDESAAMNTRIALMNRPPAVRGYWRADFEHDPTTIDVNGDDQADWTTASNPDITPANLVDGVWRADTAIAAQPTDMLITPTEIRLRMRHTQADGGGPFAWIYVDRANGTIGGIATLLQRQADGSQALVLYNETAPDTWTMIGLILGLPDGFVDVHLRIDPRADTVNLQINGVDYGTYDYDLRSASAGNGLVVLFHYGSNVEYDYAEMVVQEAQ